MKIIEFDIVKGIFNFELTELNTEFHAHPVLEVIIANQGTFTLNTPEQEFKQLTFAIIDSNITHKLKAEDSILQLLMIESHNSFFSGFLDRLKTPLENGVFVESNSINASILFNQLLDFSRKNDLARAQDVRVQKCIEILNGADLNYHEMIPEIRSKVHLSGSRMSHIFKGHIGISIKKFLVWCKLKKAFHLMITEKVSLVEAAHESGFYDQAHLSNAFKSMFGITPSKEYNSRTLQL